MSYTKFLLLFLVLILGACSSSPKKQGTPEQQQRYQLALVALDAGRDKEALALLTAFVKSYPEFSGPHANLAQLYQRLDQPDKAERHFEKAMALVPESAAVYNVVGIYYRKQGRFVDAEKAYLAAIKREPRNSDVLLNLGILYDLYLRQPSRAIVFYRRYQSSIDKKNPQVALWIANLEKN